MRATIDGIEVEGTPQEIAAFLSAHRNGLTQSSMEQIAQPHTEEEEEDERFASEKIAYRTLKRRPLSSSQRDLFRVLAKAYPKWVLATTLQDALGQTANQLGGTLGGIGRRLSTTEGYVVGSSMIEWMWDADEGQHSYRLPESVRRAVVRFDL